MFVDTTSEFESKFCSARGQIADGQSISCSGFPLDVLLIETMERNDFPEVS